MNSNADNQQLPEERGIPSVSDSSERRGRPVLAAIFVLFMLLVGGALAAYFIFGKKSTDEEVTAEETQPDKSGAPPITFANAPPPPPDAELALQQGQQPGYVDPGQPAGAPQPGANGQVQPPPPKPTLDRSRSTMMVHEAAGGDTSSGGSAVADIIAAASASTQGGGLGGGGASSGLGAMLKGTATPGSSASMLSDRNMTIAQGQMIDCVLKTRLDSTVPGMATCVVTRNLYSDNGRVVLVERGSEVVGEYSQGVQQGKARLFVLWTRLRTPNGVIIALESPGTDALGASGLPGHVNHHFWRRFGAAMLLSVIDDTAAYIANGRNSGGTTVNYGAGTSDAASQLADRVLESTINIPPTLTKNQGDRINIFIARDLYFGDVYGLASTSTNNR